MGDYLGRLSCCVLFKKEDVKRASFNLDQFLQRRTIFSSENIGPADQNFQDQYSRGPADQTSRTNIPVTVHLNEMKLAAMWACN